VPTPWEKDDYDEMALEWRDLRKELNDRVAELRRRGAPEAEVKAAEEEYSRRDREHAVKAHEYLEKSKYAGKVGVFEGAGYATKGLYRPMIDCIMFTKAQTRFCKVCEEAMIRMIAWYSE
jgi:hypothetical protein